ncbi:MAG: response regulator [Deltaproteobacteria bacterium]|nr:response regulator [Deltaproteobacteria bacterium]
MDAFRALVVDDEEDFLETIVKRLNKRSIDTTGAKSGEEALELMKEKLFDVVILDIKMPGGMDGIEALKEMKKIQPRAEVLLLTGHASVETSIEGMKLGAFDYLLKPVKLEDLLLKLAEAFEKKDTHDQKIRSAKIKELVRFPGRVLDQEKEGDRGYGVGIPCRTFLTYIPIPHRTSFYSYIENLVPRASLELYVSAF